MFQRLLLWIARVFAARYGFRVVLNTPAALLPSRVVRLSEIVKHSGHLGHRYHVRKNLDRGIDDVMSLVSRLDA